MVSRTGQAAGDSPTHNLQHNPGGLFADQLLRYSLSLPPDTFDKHCGGFVSDDVRDELALGSSQKET